MKPKLWDGDSPVGEARARFNAVIDTPYQTASGPGFQADKKIGFHEVFLTKEEPVDEEVAAFYSLGKIGEVDHISWSETAKRKFRKAGKVNADEFQVPSLLYVGNGFGIVPKLTDTEYSVYTFYKTKNGKHFTPVVTMQSEQPGFGQSNFVLVVIPGSMRRHNKASHSWGVVVRTSDTDGYQYCQYVYYVNGAWLSGSNLRYVGFSSDMMLSRTGPTTLVAFTPVFGNDAPSPFFSVSKDNGATWVWINPGNMFADRVKSDPQHARLSDTMRFVPINPTTCLAITEYAVDPLVAGVVEYRVYKITIPTSGSPSVAQLSPLNNSETHPDNGSFVTDWSQAGPVAVMQWINSNTALPHKLVISTDAGATWIYRPLPWQPKNTGLLTWFDKDTLLCPVYDGKHSLYQSINLGVTWTKRGVIREDGVAPATDHVLRAFGVLEQFREDLGIAAVVTPGAPWVTDPSAEFSE